MILSTSFSETSLERDRFVGVHMGDITVEEEAVNTSRILLNFGLKKEANWFAKDFSD